MTLSPAYFDPFYSNRLFDIKVLFISKLLKAKEFFHLKMKNFKTGMLKGLNKDLAKMLMMVEGFKSLLLDDLNCEEAVACYLIAEKTLIKFRKTYAVFEDVKFFNLTETKDISDKILLELYSIESKLRFLAYENVRIEGDEELKKYSSIISYNSALSSHES